MRAYRSRCLAFGFLRIGNMRVVPHNCTLAKRIEAGFSLNIELNELRIRLAGTPHQTFTLAYIIMHFRVTDDLKVPGSESLDIMDVCC